MRAMHFCVPKPSGNFGDDVLFWATKKFVENSLRRQIEWIDYPLRNHTTWNVVNKANECDFVVVGGGGLLLKDTNPNSVSGWQWACSLEHLEAIEVPILVVSIGYNRFRNQPEFDPIFTEHIRTLVDRATLFSVRNTGSKKKLVEYGCDEGKIQVIPCPSIGCEEIFTKEKKDNLVLINLAGDRESNRFDRKRFELMMIKAIDTFTMLGLNVEFVNHNWNPESNCQWLIDELGSKQHDIETVWDNVEIYNGIQLYNSASVVIAMRGHAQMIPFFQGPKVISLITHDKLRWFLEDYDMIKWSLDVKDGYDAEKLCSLALERNKEYENDLNKAKEKHDTNVSHAKNLIKGAVK